MISTVVKILIFRGFMICKGQGERLRYNLNDFYEKTHFREGGLLNLPALHPWSLWYFFLCKLKKTPKRVSSTNSIF